MPRDLADVLHYFMPEADLDGRDVPLKIDDASVPHVPVAQPHIRVTQSLRASREPAALPIIAVPVGDNDVVRGAFVWNLVYEMSRMGGRTTLVAPKSEESSALWPELESSSLGGEVVVTPSRTLDHLYDEVRDLAAARAKEPDAGGLLVVHIPPRWLKRGDDVQDLLRWCLLFTSSDSRELAETYGLAKLMLALDPTAKVGVTIHGARQLAEAEEAFGRVAGCAQRHLGREITSYGCLIDDLDVYRSIVARRPIGLAHPQSRAARTLRDVARILLDDAAKFGNTEKLAVA